MATPSDLNVEATHENKPFVSAGMELRNAPLVWVLIHGRGDSAHNFIGLAPQLLPSASRSAAVAPIAPNGLWYPYSFMAPVEQNEPHLSRALNAVESTLDDLDAEGVPSRNVLLFGFSQGACLALEYAARKERELAGVVALSGALITLDHTHPLDFPILMASSEGDPHIPAARFRESVELLEARGARVEAELYPGAFHGLRPVDLQKARELAPSR